MNATATARMVSEKDPAKSLWDEAVKLAMEGLSTAEVGRRMRVSRQRARNYRGENPDSDASAPGWRLLLMDPERVLAALSHLAAAHGAVVVDVESQVPVSSPELQVLTTKETGEAALELARALLDGRIDDREALVLEREALEAAQAWMSVVLRCRAVRGGGE